MNPAGKSVVDSIVNSALPSPYWGTHGMYQLSGSGSASTWSASVAHGAVTGSAAAGAATPAAAPATPRVATATTALVFFTDLPTGCRAASANAVGRDYQSGKRSGDAQMTPDRGA